MSRCRAARSPIHQNCNRAARSLAIYAVCRSPSTARSCSVVVGLFIDHHLAKLVEVDGAVAILVALVDERVNVVL